MMAETSAQQEPQQELTITRILDAPRELVFQAWTDPERVAQWWGPKGFTTPVCELDVRPGGSILIHMRAPDGKVYPMKGAYREIQPPERIAFVTWALDEKGEPLFEVLTTLTFAAEGSKTKQTLVARVIQKTDQAAPYLAGMEVGWNLSLDRLAAFVIKG